MIINGIIFLIGIADTIIAFLMVSEKGGSFFIAWGVIAFGGFKFFYAFAERTEYQNTLKNIFFEFEEGEVKNDSWWRNCDDLPTSPATLRKEDSYIIKYFPFPTTLNLILKFSIFRPLTCPVLKGGAKQT